MHAIYVRRSHRLASFHLITDDESRRTLEMDDYFLIQPHFPWWTSERPEGARAMPDGFTYSSDTNPWQLTDAEICTIVDA